MQPSRLMALVIGDARFAFRQLRKAPLFALVAIATLALGIGANTAILALADAAWLRPLPFREPDRLLMLHQTRVDIPAGIPLGPTDFIDWRTRATAFAGMTAVWERTLPFVGRSGVAEPLATQSVTAAFFDVLGVMPLVGRVFTPADERDRPDVAVLGEAFWRTRFGGDRSIVGRAIRVDGRLLTIIGIVPASMQLLPPVANATGATAPTALWTMMVIPPNQSRGPHFLRVIGRLKAGVTIEAGRRDLAAVADGLAREYPQTNRGLGAGLEPMRTALIGPEVRLTSIVLVALAGCVLLLCCANVANLLVTRGAGRQRELAVRTAMGASPGRIAAQLVVETMVLAALGGFVGGAMAAAVLRAAPTIVPAGLIPASVALSADLRVVVVGTVIVLVVALACGLAPARFAARAALTPAMEGDGRVMSSGGGLRAALAVAQVASAIVLLCGAALLLRSFLALEKSDPGFHAGHVLTATVNLPLPFSGTTRYATDDAMRQYYDRVERGVRAIPGVRRVAWGSAMPLDGFWSGTPFEVAGDSPKPLANRDIVDYHLVDASYFSTLGITMVQGRDFTPADTAAAAPVCVVNEAFVRRYLGGRNPIGVRLRVQQQSIGPPVIAAREIVGVARQVKSRPNETVPAPQIYVPLSQNPWFQATLVVESATSAPETLLPAIRAAVARIDPDQALMQVRTIDTIAAEATARWRFRAQLVGAFAALALTLAIVGVFGLLAYSVQQRTREFGLRLAIGARGTDIARLVLGGTARVAAAGIAIGILAAAVVSRGMASLLFGVAPFDGVSFSSSAAVLAVTALLAAIGPVRRAMRINPATFLRGDS